MLPDCSAGHGVPGGVAPEAINQVWHPCAREWLGLNVVVRCPKTPRPPPTCPIITMEVGTLFGVAVPAGVNERLFVRLIVRAVAPALAAGTVITTGDHFPAAAAVGFSAAHVAVAVETAVPQE